MNNQVVCKCGKVTKPVKRYDIQKDYDVNFFKDYDVNFFKAKGMCQKCYHECKGIVPWRGHYVPWHYKNHSEVSGDTPIEEKYHEDVNAQLPKISMNQLKWSKRYGMWKVSFSSPDIGGYSCQLVWYFRKKKDIIEAMMDKDV